MNNVPWGRSIPQHYAVVADDECERTRGAQLVQPGQSSAMTPKPPQTVQVLLRTLSVSQYLMSVTAADYALLVAGRVSSTLRAIANDAPADTGTHG